MRGVVLVAVASALAACGSGTGIASPNAYRLPLRAELEQTSVGWGDTVRIRLVATNPFALPAMVYESVNCPWGGGLDVAIDGVEEYHLVGCRNGLDPYRPIAIGPGDSLVKSMLWVTPKDDAGRSPTSYALSPILLSQWRVVDRGPAVSVEVR